jgi:hypothetical protein
MAGNRSYDTEGMDHPIRQWLQQEVVALNHPEWGRGRVLRWYPATGGESPRLRVMFSAKPAPQVISVSDVSLVSQDT